MTISQGQLKGYEIVGELKLGSKVQVLKPDGSGYKVDIKSDGRVVCNCPHFRFRGGSCKHSSHVASLVPPPVRYSRVEIEPLIREVLTHLLPAIEQVEVCGSYRRGKPDIKDVDLVIVGTPVLALCIAESVAKDVVMSGEHIIRFHYGDKRVMFDLTFTDKKEWGACVLYRTGSKEFNIKSRTAAKKMGWLLNEHGLFDDKGVLQAAESEAEILRLLGIGWKEPSER